MGKDNITYTSNEGTPEPIIISKLIALYSDIFSDTDTKFFKQRISEHPKLFAILAFQYK
jgi:hypothetical protein